MRLWPSGPGTTLPWWIGGFDSRQALSFVCVCLPCDGAGVPPCLSNRRDGFDSRTGRSLFRAEAERQGDRLIRGSGQVRLLPARLCRKDEGRKMKALFILRNTPVAQWRRHLSYKEAIIAGSSPAGGTAEWTGVWLPARSHKPLTPVQIRPPQLTGLWSNGKTPAWRAGYAGSTPAGSTRMLAMEGSRIRVAGPVR